MRRGRGRRLALTALLAASFALHAAPVRAQDEGAEEAIPTTAPEGVEVIRIKGKTVTAMETEVPASVAQFDPSTIAALGAQNVADLAKVTPNVEIRTSSATTATFFIRGVGLSDFNANASGAVAIYQDEVAMNSPALQLGQLFDLANVNVLRGPQGSGAGRNASAGAIKISSRKPTDDFEAAFRADLGISEEDLSNDTVFGLRDFEGAVQIPIVEERISSRFAFRLKEDDPFRVNRCSRHYGEVPLEERQADWSQWDRVRVCGANANRRRPRPPAPPPRFTVSLIDPVGTHEVNDASNWAGRGQLRFLPPELDDLRMEFTLNFHGSQLDQMSTLGQVVGTGQNYYGGPTGGDYIDPDIREMLDELIVRFNGDTVQAREALGNELARNLDKRPYRGDYNRVGQTELDVWGTFLRGDFEIGDSVEMTVISAYDTYDRKRDTDADFQPAVLFEPVVDDEGWQFLQDLRLTGEIEDYSLRWSMGGFALYEEIDNDQTVELETSTTASNYKQETTSFGIYAGFEWDFLEDFTLELGGRYNWERKKFDFELITGLNGPNPPRSFLQNLKDTWDAPTGTIALRYRFSPEVQMYTKLSRGWKGGHFNGSATFEDTAAPAGPETITATETGVSGRFWDGRISGRAAFFYYRYEDYQVFLFDESSTSFPNLIVINANDAETLGTELELTFKPIEDLVPDLYDGFTLTTQIGWLRSEFIDFTQEKREAGPDGPRSVTLDYSGNPLIASPKWKVVLSTSWPLDFGRYGIVTPRYDGVWTDDTFFDPTEGRGNPGTDGELLPEFAIGQRAHWIHNIRLSYLLPQSQMEVAFFVRNLTNRVVKTYAFNASLFAQSVINFVGEPRTYGVSLSFKF